MIQSISLAPHIHHIAYHDTNHTHWKMSHTVYQKYICAMYMAM